MTVLEGDIYCESQSVFHAVLLLTKIYVHETHHVHTMWPKSSGLFCYRWYSCSFIGSTVNIRFVGETSKTGGQATSELQKQPFMVVGKWYLCNYVSVDQPVIFFVGINVGQFHVVAWHQFPGSVECFWREAATTSHPLKLFYIVMGSPKERLKE